MKTSNKLLVAVAVLLTAAAVANAWALKHKFNNLVASGTAELRDFPVERFHSINLSGTAPQRTGGLRVTVKKGDRFSVSYTAMDFIHIDQEGDTLTISVDPKASSDGDVRRVPEIMIECPELFAVTAIGTPLDSMTMPPGTNEATRRYYQRSEVSIAGFLGPKMDLVASNGMEVMLDGLKVDSLTAMAHHAAKVTIRQNALGHAALNVDNDANVSIEHSQIGTLDTEVAETGQFNVTSTKLSTHGKRD